MKRSKLIVFLFLWAIILLELVLRIAFYEKLKTRQLEINWINVKEIGYLPAPNSLVSIANENVDSKLQTNSIGLYGTEIRQNRNPGYFRVLMVGGPEEISNYSSNNKSYFDMACEQMRDEEYKVEFINCSMDDGSRTYFRMDLTKKRLYKLKPQLILLKVSLPVYTNKLFRDEYKGYLLEYGSKDSIELIYAKKTVDQLETKKIFTYAYDISFIFRAFCKVYAARHKLNISGNDLIFKDQVALYADKKYKSSMEPQLLSESELIEQILQLQTFLKDNGTALCLVFDNEPKEKIFEKYVSSIYLQNLMAAKTILFNKTKQSVGAEYNANLLVNKLTNRYIPKKYLQEKVKGQIKQK